MTENKLKSLPYGRQFIDDEDIEAVRAVLVGDYLTTGPTVDRFESDLAKFMDVPHVVACSNGTTALHLAACAIGIEQGDVVIVPTVTFLATANGPKYCGAEIVFADVDPESGLMTYDSFLDAISRSPRKPTAVFVVHLNGQHVDMREITGYCRQNGIWIVEDACHALGGLQPLPAQQESVAPTGACLWSDLSVFSFHPVKSIATGEGGAIATRSPDLADKMKRLRNHGMTRQPDRFQNKHLAFDEDGNANPWYYELQELGFNYRLSDINCALGISQLKKLPRFIEKRRQLADRYVALLGGSSNAVKHAKFSDFGDSGWHLFPVLIDFQAIGISRATFFSRLREQSIIPQVHYIPVHLQPYYFDEKLSLPGSERYYSRVVSLPLFVAMELEDVDTVVSVVHKLTSGE